MAGGSTATQWFALAERGSHLGLATLAYVYRRLGRTACLIATAPVVFCFYLTGTARRRASIDYLRRVWAANGSRRRPGRWQALVHFLTFGAAVVDKFGAWIGETRRTDVDGIDSSLFRAT